MEYKMEEKAIEPLEIKLSELRETIGFAIAHGKKEILVEIPYDEMAQDESRSEFEMRGCASCLRSCGYIADAKYDHDRAVFTIQAKVGREVTKLGKEVIEHFQKEFLEKPVRLSLLSKVREFWKRLKKGM